MTAPLEVVGLTKKRGSKLVVDRVSLEVQNGEVVGLLGPNGAGKSTTLRCLLGLARPTAGECRVFGEQVPAPSLRRIGSMIEGPALYPWMSAKANILALAGRRLPPTEVDHVLAVVGLADTGRKRAAAFSHGMKQRLALAIALACQPNALVLDEPTNGLDPAGVRDFLRVLREASDRGVAVLLSSHQLGEIERSCDRVVLLNKGRVIAEGLPGQLTRKEQRVEVRISLTAAQTRERVLRALAARLIDEPAPGVFIVTGLTAMPLL